MARTEWTVKRWLYLGLFVLILLPVEWIGVRELMRPSRVDHERMLFSGVSYARKALSEPRPVVIHSVWIDLNNPDVRLLVTPSESEQKEGMIQARTTSEFLKDFGVQVAINGSLFKPHYANHPLDYFPRSGDEVNITGLAISNGEQYSEAIDRWPVLCIADGNKSTISETFCPPNTEHALAGSARPLIAGKKQVELGKEVPHEAPQPQSAIALNETQSELLLVAIDGRQAGYSEGLTTEELSTILLELGAYDALQLDGGGSTTLVVEDAAGKPRVLNSPIHTKIPGRERPVGNHLGVFAHQIASNH